MRKKASGGGAKGSKLNVTQAEVNSYMTYNADANIVAAWEKCITKTTKTNLYAYASRDAKNTYVNVIWVPGELAPEAPSIPITFEPAGDHIKVNAKPGEQIAAGSGQNFKVDCHKGCDEGYLITVNGKLKNAAGVLIHSYSAKVEVPPKHPRIRSSAAGSPSRSQRIDAVIIGHDGNAYFFHGDKFITYNIKADEATGSPTPIDEKWKGLWPDGVDAGVTWPDGKAYFFKGSQFVQYDLKADRVEKGYPQPISNRWKGVWPDHIDAVLVWNDGKAYFFRGREYTKYDIKGGTIDPGYPQPVANNWPGLPWVEGIDTAVFWPNGYGYFFRGTQYARYNPAKDKVGAVEHVAVIAKYWHGLQWDPE